MSFYDLTKDNVLSANELFKYRLKRDATLPSKGGQKVFEPDGSWSHAKALEGLMQERTRILGEQRVEKLKSLFQGVWEVDKRLVNLNKPGKFWAHMGFTDKRRNWLYPEEALFLIETNTLEVYHCDLPLSIQEAYSKFIGPDLCLEEYQVYSHLRRLGYVVLRQENELEITPYEKQINLDQYMTKQNRKERKQKQLAKRKPHSNPTEPQDAMNESSVDINQDERHLDDSKCENSALSISKSSLDESSVEEQEKSLEGDSLPVSTDTINPAKRLSENENETDIEIPLKIVKLDNCNEGESHLTSTTSEEESDSSLIDARWYVGSQWVQCFKKCHNLKPVDGSSKEKNLIENKVDDISEPNKNEEAKVRPKTFPFPSIANTSILSLPQPTAKLLPPNLDVNEDFKDVLVFNVSEYRVKNPSTEGSVKMQKEEDREARIRSLEFSFAEWTNNKPLIKAKSWAEYKLKAKQAISQTATCRTPVDHLWGGAVTPLVRPQDAMSKQAVLDCLSIIQSADNESLIPNSDCLVDLKVSYSVHLPDSKFKKSMPGTPNHRVCVVKCSSEPPNLAEIQEVWSRFKDNVPLHCAVVDSGEIAFYIFDNTFKLDSLP